MSLLKNIFLFLFFSSCIHPIAQETELTFKYPPYQKAYTEIQKQKKSIQSEAGHFSSLGPLESYVHMKIMTIAGHADQALMSGIRTEAIEEEFLAAFRGQIDNKPIITPESEAILRSRVRDYADELVNTIEELVIRLHEADRAR